MSIDGEEAKGANGWRLHSLPGIDPTGFAVNAITAAVVGTLFLIYLSIPNRSPKISGGVYK